MTPQDAITTARGILNDTDATAPRNTDAELLRYVNEGLSEIAQYKPVLFSDIEPFACLAGAVEQVVDLADAMAVIECVRVQGGNALTVFDAATLDAFLPSWRAGPPGVPEQWAPVPNDPMRFLLAPPPIAAQTVEVRVARNPGEYGLTDQILYLPDSFLPALVDYIVYRAELKDDENVLTQRSGAMYLAFLRKIGVSNASGSQ